MDNLVQAHARNRYEAFDWIRDVFTQGQTVVLPHPIHLAARIGDLCCKPYDMESLSSSRSRTMTLSLWDLQQSDPGQPASRAHSHERDKKDWLWLTAGISAPIGKGWRVFGLR